MEGNLQPKIDTHQISLELDGLDQLLDATPDQLALEQIDLMPVTEAQGNEKETLLKLFARVHEVNAAVEEARHRITQANERMTTLTAVLQLQTDQLELLGHYQTQAAKATTLEMRIANLEQENAELKRTWLQKLLRRFKGSQ